MKILKNIGKAVILIAIVVVLFYVSIYVLISILWSGEFRGYEYIPMTLYGITALGVLTFISTCMWNRRSIKKVSIITLIFGILFGLTFPINAAYHAYQESLVISEPEINVENYAPFSGKSDLAKLDLVSTLKLEDDLPRLDGATALYPVYSAFAEAVYPNRKYSANNSEVQCQNTIGAYENLINGVADIIFVAQPSKEQMDLAISRGVDLHMTPIGNEAFVFFVNKKNKVDNLTFNQLKGIYSGEITNWKTVNGSNTEIIPYQRNVGSGSQTMFLNIMKDVNIQKAPQEQTIGGMGDIIEKTARYKNSKNSIGFSFLYYTTKMKNNDNIKIIAINGIKPTKETIANKSYAFTGTFYAITNGEPKGNSKLLIDWILSEQGQELIKKTGYVGL